MIRLRMSAALVATLAIGCAGQDESSAVGAAESISAPVYAVDAANFRAHLHGRDEVPANDSRAQGQATFQLSADGTELRFKLNVANIVDVRQAHIHRAPAGVNGGIVVWLYPDAPPPVLIPGRTQGTLGEGVITDAEVIGSLAGTGVAGLLAELRAGNAYVNVHTVLLPGGEVRGQVH